MNDDVDANLLAKLYESGICANVGTPPMPNHKPYICSLDRDHPGAHVAKIAGTVVDTWATTPANPANKASE